MLLVAACIILDGAPAEAAEISGSGIEHVWGNEQAATGVAGGQFNAPREVAVDDATGDVFVADMTNHRIQQFSDSGEFIRAWGQDVIANVGNPPNSNGTGFEICDTTTDPPNQATDCKAGITSSPTGGALSGPQGLAFNQDSGHLYVTDVGFNRVQQFRFNATTGRPEFVRAFGQDVASGGAENKPAASAVQTLTIPAEVSGGTYTLSFRGETTVPLAYDAPAIGGTNPADSVQNALAALSTIGASGVSVSGTGPYAITFAGPLANAPMPPITVDSSGLIGGSASVALTTQGATGFEICETAANCKAGVTAGAGPGTFQTMGYLAVVPNGGTASIAGDVLVANKGKNRIDEFTATGDFVRAFGFDVVSSPPNSVNTFEVCEAASFDVCKAGLPGSGVGQFGNNAVLDIAADAAGNLYTVEPTVTWRVQEFAVQGNAVAAEGPFACTVLCGTANTGSNANNPTAVAVDAAGDVYVVKSFPQGTGSPLVVTPPEQDPLGCFIGCPVQQRVLKLDRATEQVTDAFLVNPGAYRFGTDTQVRAIQERGNSLQGLAVKGDGSRLYVSNHGTQLSRSRIYRAGGVEGFGATVEASEVSAASVTVEATIAPPSLPLLNTTFHLEYRRSGTSSWLEEPTVDVNIGNGVDGGESSECAPAVGARAALCHVSTVIGGLDVDTVYEVRLAARTELNGIVFASDPLVVDTSSSPPTASTGTAGWSGPPSRDPSLIFTGEVNPQGAQTSYHFDYVDASEFAASGWANAAQVPVFPRDVGHGRTRIDVTAVASGLDSSRAYVYRLVASNAQGTTVDDPRSVQAAAAGGRFLEFVTEGDNQGAGPTPTPLRVSDDGQRVVFNVLAFGEAGCNPGLVNPFTSLRGPSGWLPVPMCLPGSPGGESAGGIADAALGQMIWDESPTLDTRQWVLRGVDAETRPLGPVLRPLDRSGNMGSYRVLGATPDFSNVVFANGESGANGKTLFADEPLVLGGYSNLYAIRDANAGMSQLELVNRDVNGDIIGGGCGAMLGAARSPHDEGTSTNVPTTRAVSADGSVVYFSARPSLALGEACNENAPVRLFKRVDGTTTVPVSASQCSRPALPDPPGPCSGADGDDFFWGASADGSRVFFTSPRQLTDADVDTGPLCTDRLDADGLGCDLYLYDAEPPDGEPSLVQVSAGEANADHPTVGAGAEVLGVTDVSMDGSRVYFVAQGRLTAEATDGAANLYVFERDEDHPAGRLDFIAVLSDRESVQTNDPGDRDLWSRLVGGQGARHAYALPFYDGLGAGRTAGDGRYLIFVSEAQLLAEDGDSSDDLYRYDDEANPASRLVCLSCSKDGSFHVQLQKRLLSNAARPDDVARSRIASEDGSSVVFATAERLLADDANSATDAYLWQQADSVEGCEAPGRSEFLPEIGGCISLISGGTGADGVFANALEGGPVISPDGQSIFFTTRATMLPQDTNNSGWDVYAARINGGFQQPADLEASDPCKAIGDLCQGPDPAPVPASPSPSSVTLVGSGNVKETSRRPCPKGKHRAEARRRNKKGRSGKTKARCVPNRIKQSRRSSQHERRAGSDRRVAR